MTMNENATEYTNGYINQLRFEALEEMYAGVTYKMIAIITVLALVSAIGSSIALCVLNCLHKKRWRKKRRMMRKMIKAGLIKAPGEDSSDDDDVNYDP